MSFRKKNKQVEAEEEDMKVSHAKGSQGAEEAPAQQVEQPQQAEQSQQQAEPSQQADQETTEEQPSSDDEDDDSEPVPDGTTAEILQWVGEDQDKAQRALDKEQAEQKPRPGLTRGLKKILEK